MKANIERGKLITPKSLGAGLKRRKQLEFEINRIEQQITDTGQAARYEGKPEEYAAWCASATRAVKLFHLERRLLDEWIDVRQNDSERLLKEAHTVLKVLENEVDFEAHEVALVQRIDSFLQT